MILDSVDLKLEVVLGGAVTTNQLDIAVSYTQGGIQQTPFAVRSVTNDTTDVTILAAPSAKEKRVVQFLSIRNKDTAQATVTLKYDDGSTEWQVLKVVLSVDDTLYYTLESGFKVMDSTGSFKNTIVGTLDHGALSGLGDNDHTIYIRHALSTAANDFLVGSGSNTYVKKTLVEVGAILEADLDHGSIQGLSGDDHTLYLLADGSRALAGAWDMGSQALTNVNIDSGVITGITDLVVADGGTGVSTLTDGGVLLGSGVGAITVLAQATNGQLVVGSTSADPVLATLTGTSNEITVTNGAGTITLSMPTTVTIGSAVSPDGTLHVHTATAGAVTADVGSDDLIVENSGNTGVSVLCPNANIGRYTFGNPLDDFSACTEWDRSNLRLMLATSTTDGVVRISTANGVTAIDIDKNQQTVFVASVTIGGAIEAGSIFNIEPGVAQRDLLTSVGLGLHIEADTWDINVSGNGETVAIGPLAFLGIPTWTSTGTTYTVTKAATLYIQGAPVASTNVTLDSALSLWVDAGDVEFDGALTVGGALGVTGVTTFTGKINLLGTLEVNGDDGANGEVLTSQGAGVDPIWSAGGGGAVTALNDATEDELVTVGNTTTELDAESALTFDGSTLTLTGDAIISDQLTIGGAIEAGSIFNIEPGVAQRDLLTSVGLGIHVEADSWDINASGNGETVAIGSLAFLGIPTWSSTGTTYTVTTAATLYIQGAPVAGGNVTLDEILSLWVDTGDVKFDNSLGLGTSAPTGTAGDLSMSGDLVVGGVGPHAIGGAISTANAILFTGSFTPAGGAASGLLTIDSTSNPGNNDQTAGLWVKPTLVEGDGGTHSNFNGARFDAPTVTGGAAALTNASTIKITAAPSGATNNYSLWVDAGSVRLDGSLWVEGTPTEGTSGEQLTSGGASTVMTWAAASSLREYKQDIVQLIDPNISLELLLNTNVYSFKYLQPEYKSVTEKDEEGNDVTRQVRVNRKPSTGDFDTEYVGVMANEAPWATHYEGRIFNPISFAGHTVLAIQALEARITELETQR